MSTIVGQVHVNDFINNSFTFPKLSPADKIIFGLQISIEDFMQYKPPGLYFNINTYSQTVPVRLGKTCMYELDDYTTDITGISFPVQRENGIPNIPNSLTIEYIIIRG